MQTLELGPDGLLERGAGEPHRNVEVETLAREVLVELVASGPEHIVGVFWSVIVGEHAAALDGETGDGLVVGDEFETPDRAFEADEVHVRHDSSVTPGCDTGSRESDIADTPRIAALWRRSGIDSPSTAVVASRSETDRARPRRSGTAESHAQPMTTIIRAEAAHDFLALVPSLAGFHPQRSLVCVAFSGNRTAGVLRYDLPRLVRDRAPLVASVIGTMCRMHGVDAVVPIVYTGARFGTGRGMPQRALLGMLTARAEEAGFLVRDALCRAADGWGSLLDPTTPAMGHPLALIDESPVTRFAEDVREVASSPSSSAALPPEEPEAADRIAEALEQLTGDGREDALRRLGADGDPVTLVESLLMRDAVHPPLRLAWFLHLASIPAVRDAMMLQVGFGALVGEAAHDDAIATAERAAAHDETIDGLVVRELASGTTGAMSEMLSRLMIGQSQLRPDAGRVERALAVLRRLIADAPPAHRVGPLCIAAWLSWSLGRGSAAGAFIDRAIELDPGHTMADLLAALIGSGALPEWAFSGR